MQKAPSENRGENELVAAPMKTVVSSSKRRQFLHVLTSNSQLGELNDST